MDIATIGIEKRISLGVLELALRAAMDGSATPEYFKGLAMTECSGENRIKKVVVVLNRMTIKNKLLDYINDNRQKVESLMNSHYGRSLLYVAIMCSAYRIFYDTISILGKFFHVQDQVKREYLLKKLSEIYGSNRSLEVGFDCIIPMLMEAKFISRPKPGVYEIIRQQKFSEDAKNIYVQSFLLNNPMYQNADNFELNSYFEFLR